MARGISPYPNTNVIAPQKRVAAHSGSNNREGREVISTCCQIGPVAVGRLYIGGFLVAELCMSVSRTKVRLMGRKGKGKASARPGVLR